MLITNHQLLCEMGTAAVNEDAAAITPCGAWVLDGATGLSGRNIIDDKSDTRWFVKWWNDYLERNIQKNMPLKEIVRTGIRAVKKDFRTLTKGEYSDIDIPSSTLVLIRWRAGQIEYFCLGDSILSIRHSNVKETIIDPNLRQLDENVFHKMRRLMDELSIGIQEAKSALRETIVSNRLLKNKSGGYWILSLDEEAADHGLCGTISIDREASVLLATDGFSSISEKYGLVPLDDLIDAVEKRGAEEIYHKIRKIEELDRHGRLYPRFKQSDDASAVFLKLQTV